MKKLALIVLASEQLWPNIHSLTHWAENKEHALTDVFIYHTADEQRSHKPALRFEQLCRSLYPKIRIHFPDAACIFPEQPDAVYSQIMRWREKLPNCAWIINATGGLKLMFAGALDCIGSTDVTVVYRELSGTWYELLQQNHHTLSKELDIHEHTDHIPVTSLVKAQWQIGEGTTFTTEKSWDISAEQIYQIVQSGIACRWDWTSMFEQNKLPIGTGHAGAIFEQFVGAILRVMGIQQLELNLKISAQQGQNLHEIDIVANHGGRLLIIDCKLRTEEEEANGRVEKITSQIRQADATQRSLGGLSTQMLLLRPNRTLTEDERALLEAYKLRVIEKKDAWNLFTTLAKFVRIPVQQIPQPLLDAEKLLLEQKNQGISSPLSPEPSWKTQLFPPTEGRAILHMNRLEKAYNQKTTQTWSQYRREFLERYMRDQEQDWVAFYNGKAREQDAISLIISTPKTWTVDDIHNKIDSLKTWGELIQIERSASKQSVMITLQPTSKKSIDALSESLHTKIGQSFWPR